MSRHKFLQKSKSAAVAFAATCFSYVIGLKVRRNHWIPWWVA